MTRDFLDEPMEESTRKDPDYPRKVAAARQRRAAARALSRATVRYGLTQTSATTGAQAVATDVARINGAKLAKS